MENRQSILLCCTVSYHERTDHLNLLETASMCVTVRPTLDSFHHILISCHISSYPILSHPLLSTSLPSLASSPLFSSSLSSLFSGLHSMSSDVPQVRALLSALAGCVFISEVRNAVCMLALLTLKCHDVIPVTTIE